MNSFKYIYSVSDVKDLIKDTIVSTKTLLKFTDKKNIIIFYTPPRCIINFKILSNFGKVIFMDNIGPPLKVEKGYGRYGDKFHALFYRTENLVFLDSDTLIMRDFSKTLEGDFEFAGRIAPNYFNLDQKIWQEMFRLKDKPMIPMINAGLMIFKNYLHNKIAETVNEYMNSHLGRPDPRSNQKDQYALSLAVSDRKIKWLTENEFSFMGKGEFKGDILHGTIPRIGSDLSLIYKRNRIRLTRLFLRIS